MLPSSDSRKSCGTGIAEAWSSHRHFRADPLRPRCTCRRGLGRLFGQNCAKGLTSHLQLGKTAPLRPASAPSVCLPARLALLLASVLASLLHAQATAVDSSELRLVDVFVSQVVEACRRRLLAHRRLPRLLPIRDALLALSRCLGGGHHRRAHPLLVHPLLQPFHAVLSSNRLDELLGLLAAVLERVAHTRGGALLLRLIIHVSLRLVLGRIWGVFGAAEAHVVPRRVLRVAHARARRYHVVEGAVGRVEVGATAQHALPRRLGEVRSGPLPHVAEHVVDARLVGLEGIRRREARVTIEGRVCVRETALPQVEAPRGVIAWRLIAPRVGLARLARAEVRPPCGHLPLRLSRKSLRRPLAVRLGVVEGDVHNRVAQHMLDS
mmetsp:Transcript_23417/g.54190  ORF Transcript_23417/g.54190 Transcript_23417/m.54190 type:complete len:380 (+) Transcript_23417:375-1514(+)